MYRLALTCALIAATCHAQIPFSPNPPARRGSAEMPVPGSGLPTSIRDQREWNGPLIPLPGETRFYRTVGVGQLAEFPATGTVDPSAVLVGFEISTSGNTLFSIQPFYLVGGRRMSGLVIGEVRGTRSQVLAQEGYAVREVRFSSPMRPQGFHVLFARIQADGTLSETDLLTSDPRGQSVTALHAGGLPFCGMLGTGRGSVESLTLLVSQSLVLNLKPALTPVPRERVASATPPTVPAGTAAQAGTPGALPPGVTPLSPIGTAVTPVADALAPVSTLTDTQLGEIVRTTGDSLIFVEGGEGKGSGFLCMMNGKRVLLTNQHVIRGNPAIQFTTLNQTAVKVGPARAAAAHDIIAYDVPDALPALELMTDFAQSVSVGDDVVVLGNTEGARVIKPLGGKVVGLGPSLVEISSEFMPGNSGSPIIHVKSNKVIGIATYAIIRDVNSLTGQKQPSVRRFGYRFDSVQTWQPVNWAIYQAEAAATKKVGDFSGAIISLLLDLRSRRFDPSKHGDSRLRPALAHLGNLTRTGITQVDRTRMVQNFLGEIRNATQRDVNDLKTRLRYDYFQRELAEEGKFRTEIYNGLGEAMKELGR